MQIWKLEIEYEGTRYGGWQKQPGQTRTIQGELLRAAGEFLKTGVEIGGAGRTDAGVHALCQVAHLKIRTRIKSLSARQLQIGINDLLPYDINLLSAQPARTGFHARHDAQARYYLYQISTRRTAFGKPYVWWIKDRLDLEAMKKACALLAGRHDFRSFCEPSETQSSTMVQIDAAQIVACGSLILFRIGASHFLWKMVRRITGALVEVGRGRLTVERFGEMLESESREAAAWTAPPSGLFLERVLYQDERPPSTIGPIFPVP